MRPSSVKTFSRRDSTVVVQHPELTPLDFKPFRCLNPPRHGVSRQSIIHGDNVNTTALNVKLLKLHEQIKYCNAQEEKKNSSEILICNLMSVIRLDRWLRCGF